MTRFTTTARTALLLTIASGFLTLATPAFADGDSVPQATLNVAHTNFASVKSVSKLTNRVRRTAYEICMANSASGSLMSSDERQCYKTAIRSGQAQVDSKQMAALASSAPEVAAVQPREHLSH